MLVITVSMSESFDEKDEVFISEDYVLELEHSLVSLSKWESKFRKPFLTDKEKSNEETLSYIECMTLTPNTPPEVFHNLSQENVDEIAEYIQANLTATWFKEVPNNKKSRTITSELIYYWMSSLNIPMECQNWHLSRLFTLLRVFDSENSDGKPKKSTPDDLQARRELNARRRREMGTRG